MKNIIMTSNIDEAVEKVNFLVDTMTDGLVVYSGDKPCVLRGRIGEYDKEYCTEHDLSVGRADYVGGIIVCAAGDLSLCLVTKKKTEFALNVVDKLKELYGPGAVNNKNDVLLDEKKVTSWSRNRCKGIWLSVVQISINTDLDLIHHICKKPMNKVPGALSDYGITAEDCWTVIEPIVAKE